MLHSPVNQSESVSQSVKQSDSQSGETKHTQNGKIHIYKRSKKDQKRTNKANGNKSGGQWGRPNFFCNRIVAPDMSSAGIQRKSNANADSPIRGNPESRQPTHSLTGINSVVFGGRNDHEIWPPCALFDIMLDCFVLFPLNHQNVEKAAKAITERGQKGQRGHKKARKK